MYRQLSLDYSDGAENLNTLKFCSSGLSEMIRSSEVSVRSLSDSLGSHEQNNNLTWMWSTRTPMYLQTRTETPAGPSGLCRTQNQRCSIRPWSGCRICCWGACLRLRCSGQAGTRRLWRTAFWLWRGWKSEAPENTKAGRWKTFLVRWRHIGWSNTTWGGVHVNWFSD